MNFVTPQEAVHRRNMIVQAQAQARARVRAQPHTVAQSGNIAMPKLGKRNQVVEFITINRKK